MRKKCFIRIIRKYFDLENFLLYKEKYKKLPYVVLIFVIFSLNQQIVSSLLKYNDF